jgi:3-methyl-2-oxobutanoate hydroxymethyltransferase
VKNILFKRKPIVCLTAYNKFTAQIADEFCDLILVGDSLGMAYYGFSTTRAVSLDDIIRHAKSVKLGIKKSIMVVDMPFGTYTTKKSALKNAKKIIQVTKCDAVKLEGGKEKSEIIKYLIKNKINVMGHVGLLPQKIKSNKDYKIKGRNFRERKKLINDIKHLEQAGVFSIVLEATSFDAAEDVLKHSKVPIVGIGASVNCDGQILVTEDLLGFFDKVPKFVKKYTNLKKQVIKAIGNYAKDVRSRKFPTKQNIYN